MNFWIRVSAVLVCLLTTNYVIMMRWSQRDGEYKYSTMSLVLCIEFGKFLSSTIFLKYEKGDNFIPYIKNSFSGWISLLYAIPAILYAIQNNLNYYCMLFLLPATFQLLGNLRTLTTGVMYRIVLKRYLSQIQWIALLILTLGTTISQLNFTNDTSYNFSVIGFFLVLFICTTSALAGCINELVMKKYFSHSIHFQNMQLYLFGTIVNFIAWYFSLSDNEGQSLSSFFAGYNWVTWFLIPCMVLQGILVSVILKYANVIVKVYAACCSLVLTALVASFLFDQSISVEISLGTILVIIAVLLYDKYPIDNSKYIPNKVKGGYETVSQTDETDEIA